MIRNGYIRQQTPRTMNCEHCNGIIDRGVFCWKVDSRLADQWSCDKCFSNETIVEAVKSKEETTPLPEIKEGATTPDKGVPELPIIDLFPDEETEPTLIADEDNSPRRRGKK